MHILITTIILMLTVFCTPCFGLSINNIFTDDHSALQSTIYKSRQTRLYTAMEPNDLSFDKIINTTYPHLNASFKISSSLYDQTLFWFNIYTKYNDKQVVIHDKENLAIVYDVFDFTALHESKLNKHIKYSIQNELIAEKIKEIKLEIIGSLHNQKSVLSKKIIKLEKDKKIIIPKQANQKSQFYSNLMQNIRAQTGQKSNISRGITNYYVFQNEIKKYIKFLNVPKELLAIAFVESSFNIRAKSRVGATGAWQFLNRTAKYFLPMNKHTDSRLNPLLSTLGAFHLLKQNKQILKRWDKAVTAYNTGTKPLILAQKKFKDKNLSIDFIFNNFKHPQLGFAATNYYTEFLALSYTLPNKHLFFSPDKNLISYKPIEAYISLCSFRPYKLFKSLKKSSPYLNLLNLHLKKIKKNYQKGTIVFSDINLTKKRYIKVPNHYYKKYPKRWYRLSKNLKCKK